MTEKPPIPFYKSFMVLPLFRFFLLCLATVSGRGNGCGVTRSFCRGGAVTGGCCRGWRTVGRGRRFLFYILGATCTLLPAASAAGTKAQGAKTCNQAGDTDPGQHLFQVFLLHVSLLFKVVFLATNPLFPGKHPFQRAWAYCRCGTFTVATDLIIHLEFFLSYILLYYFSKPKSEAGKKISSIIT